MFETLQTGIKELDLILDGGIRYPRDTAAFVFITGGPGTGKTILGLEMVTRAWLARAEGDGVFLFYSVEQTPRDLQRKLEGDFGGYFGCERNVRVVEDGLLGKVRIEVDAPGGGVNRLLLLQANPAALQVEGGTRGRPAVDIEWIQAEIGNLARVDNVVLACIDNVGLLLSDLKYVQKRAALLQTRRDLARYRIHGIFIQEEPGSPESRLPSPEEFSTDLLLRLSFQNLAPSFKARMIEVEKARHQYYYRGSHHFSIVGKGLQREHFLGARSERGPGVHIYPSVPTQLSLLRDATVNQRPPRGPERLLFGVPELDAAFPEGHGPLIRSSTVLLAEPGSSYTSFALRFALQGLAQEEPAFFVSTKEDEDAILRMCAQTPELAELTAGPGGPLRPGLHLLYLHPELIPPGKFTWDIVDLVGVESPIPESVPRHRRLAFDNIRALDVRFPLIQEPEFLVLALLDLLRHQGVSPLFVSMLPPGRWEQVSPRFDSTPYVTRFDNVLHIFPRVRDGQSQVWCRILKAVGAHHPHEPFALHSLR